MVNAKADVEVSLADGPGPRVTVAAIVAVLPGDAPVQAGRGGTHKME
jgi:hypothetical protein